VGDALLLEADVDFVRERRAFYDFLLIRYVPNSSPPRLTTKMDFARRIAAGLVFGLAVAAMACGVVSMLTAAVLTSFVLVWIQCITVKQAFESIKGRVVLATVAAYALGDGLSNTKVTDVVAEGVVEFGTQLGPIGVLFLVFIITSAMSCIVSNQATAIILYSVVKHVHLEGVSTLQLVVMVVIGASSSFMTPFGYQTNLMVWKQGGYQFSDYTKLGTPLTLVTGLLASVLCYLWVHQPPPAPPPALPP